MPRVNRPRSCKSCGKINEDGSDVSWRGLCIDCAEARIRDANMQLYLHRGPYFDNWRRSMAACVGASFVDDPQPER